MLVLHDVNMAARFCDEILALHSSRLIARGAPEAIMTPEALAAIYGVTMDVILHQGTGRPVAVAR